jgi:hypothetical protein
MSRIQKQRSGQRILRMDIIYKRKVNKVKPVDLNKLNNSIPGESKSWREDMIREEMKNINPDSNNLYTKWLIPKFFKIIKGSRLTPKRIEKLIVKFITP